MSQVVPRERVDPFDIALFGVSLALREHSTRLVDHVGQPLVALSVLSQIREAVSFLDGFLAARLEAEEDQEAPDLEDEDDVDPPAGGVYL